MQSVLSDRYPENWERHVPGGKGWKGASEDSNNSHVWKQRKSSSWKDGYPIPLQHQYFTLGYQAECSRGVCSSKHLISELCSSECCSGLNILGASLQSSLAQKNGFDNGYNGKDGTGGKDWRDSSYDSINSGSYVQSKKHVFVAPLEIIIFN